MQQERLAACCIRTSGHVWQQIRGICAGADRRGRQVAGRGVPEPHQPEVLHAVHDGRRLRAVCRPGVRHPGHEPPAVCHKRHAEVHAERRRVGRLLAHVRRRAAHRPPQGASAADALP